MSESNGTDATPTKQETAQEQGAPTTRRGSARRMIASVLLGALRMALVVGLVSAGVFAAYWFNTSGGSAERSSEGREEISRPVETVEVRRGDHPVRVRAMGTVMAARETSIRPRVSGMIVEQAEAFAPGGFFEQGAFMVQIDRADYEQALLQRESELAQAEAALRIELGDQAVAREELELLEVDIPEINRDMILRIPQVNQAKAEVKSAEAALQRASLDLERTRISAPFEGHIVVRSASVGNNVSPGDELATFVGAQEYWVELTVPVSSLRWIQTPRTAGDASSAALVSYPRAWGPGVTREGRVGRLVGRLEEGSRLARVIVSVPDPLAREASRRGKPELILDAYVDVEIEGRVLEDAVVLDRDLVREGGVVWVMGDDQRLEIRPVTIAYRGRDHAYVTGGLDDGDRAIRTNLTTPVRGMLLREASPPSDGEAVAADG